MRYTMFPLVLFAGLVVTLTAVDAGAQEVRNRVERRQDRQDLRQDRRQTRDDARDMDRLGQLVMSFETARKNHDTTQLRELDAAVQRLLVDEMAESSREEQQKQRELRQDRREVRSDRREIAADHQMQAGLGAAVDDIHDLRDDRRDRRDDRRDVRGEQVEQRTYATIAREWTQLMDHQDDVSLARKRVLLDELQGMARVELHGDASERREDRRELREDRRETHEDRAQDRK